MTSAEHSEAVVLLFLIHCLLLPSLFCRVLCLVLQSSRWGRERRFHYILMYFDCLFSVSLPQGAVGWSTVCDCGISWLYSLTFTVILLRFLAKTL